MEEHQCELCEKRAMVHCDSDQAKLCWCCDAKVHSANFLVAKHERVLLCRICNSHTRWRASGNKLTPSTSFCHRCVVNERKNKLQHVVDDGGEYSSDDEDEEEEEEDDDENDDEEEEEAENEEQNQVVPMFCSMSLDSAGTALKRERDNISINSNIQGETKGSTSSEMLSVAATLPSGEKSTSVNSFRPSKKRRINQ